MSKKSLQGGSSMTVRKVADLQEEELEECEPVWSKHYSQEYLYVKMTSRLNCNSSSISANAEKQQIQTAGGYSR